MMNTLRFLESLRDKQIISDPVLEFARFLHHTDDRDKAVILTGAAVMQHHLEGHICSSFEAITQTLLSWDVSSEVHPDLGNHSNSILLGNGSELTPMVIENGNVYLHRFWSYERELASWMLEKVSVSDPLPEKWNKIRNAAFPVPAMQENLQIQAVERSFKKRLMVLTGGPGTGKTYTVKKILESHLHANPDLKIALAAPTGKAAQRVNESLSGTLNETVKATTIHSLLGSRGVSGTFGYGKDEPLPYDMILIDEASMMDLTLWIHLIRAIPEEARLILLGDKNQLASVEAGSIFGDVCIAARSVSIDNPLSTCVTELEKSYRFSEDGGIYLLSKAILEGDSGKAWSLLKDRRFEEIQVAEPNSDTMRKVMTEYIVNPFQKMVTNGFDHKRFNQRQILCALRKGPFGVEEINQQGEKKLRKQLSVPYADAWYHGRPVIIKRNDHTTGLRNGETGFCSKDGSGSGFVVYFEDREEGVNAIRLPDNEPAHAVSIHKSQGSEYENVAILLTNRDNPILSQELLYTAVTRARQSILVVSSHESLSRCIGRKVHRNSRLIARLTY